MTSLKVVVGDADCRFVVDEHEVSVPVGSAALATGQLLRDPPGPAELTNAIGTVLDHLDDVARQLPEILTADRVDVVGSDVQAIAAVEAGRAVSGPFELSRAAAEDVFRTLATEARAMRARNPGLAADRVDTVVGGCCVVVALMRHLQLESITVIEQVDSTQGIEPADRSTSVENGAAQ